MTIDFCTAGGTLLASVPPGERSATTRTSGIADNFVIRGSVRSLGGGGDIEFDTVWWVAGATVTIRKLSITLGDEEGPPPARPEDKDLVPLCGRCNGDMEEDGYGDWACPDCDLDEDYYR